MRSLSGVKITLMLASAYVVACGPTGSSILLPGEGGAATESGLTSIDIGLPDRTGLKTQVSDIETKMNGYRLVVASSGAGCTKIDEVKPYATKTIATSLKQGCDYQLTLSLGNLAASTGATGQQQQEDKVNYEADIKPLVAANCATSGCHDGSNALSDQRTFAGLKAAGSGAVSRVQTGSMPKGGSLTAAEKKLFADWQAAGFLEKASATATDTNDQADPKALAATYYKNVTPKAVAKAKIEGQTSVKIELNLSLQPDGKAIGLVAGGSDTTDDSADDATQQDQDADQQQSAVQLPENKNPALQGTAGATTLAQEFKGEYMLVDFSQTNCGYCKTEAEKMNSQAALQAYFTSGKCSHATIVVSNNLSAWNSYIGGAETFVAKHSFTTTSGSGLNLATTFLGPGLGTPTYILIDKQGAIVGEPSVGSIPTSALAQYCK